MPQTALFNHFKTQNSNALDILICEDMRESELLESVTKYFKCETILFPDFRATYGDDLRSYKEELQELFSFDFCSCCDDGCV